MPFCPTDITKSSHNHIHIGKNRHNYHSDEVKNKQVSAMV